MTKLKIVLGGVSGALGVTGAVLIPPMIKSEAPDTRVNSGGKAVPMSWSANTKKGTSFKSFGGIFAPWLIDVDKTDDEFWKKRVEKIKNEEFDNSSQLFVNWHKIPNTEQRISTIKTQCKNFQYLSVDYRDPGDVQRTMALCGIYDSQGKRLEFKQSTGLLTSEESWKVEEICDVLTSDMAKTICAKIEND